MNETSPTPGCSRCGAPLSSGALKGLCPRCLMALNLSALTEIPGEMGPHGTKVVQPPPTPDEIAKHFPQLEILGCLGRGGMGVVYRARQPKLNRIVALKVLAPEKVAEPKFAERFEREAQALARLNHPNIVTVYDFGETDGLYYLTMEFVDGVSLRQLIQTRKIAPEEALAIVPKICEALQFAHEQGVVHRDIKPENVLLDKSGRLKIADFGIAKIVGGTSLTPPDAERSPDAAGEGSLTQDQILGTPHYMAPEQVEQPNLVDHRADIYSLGVVFYEMLTSELPLGQFQPPSKKVQVDVRLDEIVLHALEKEPERRYQQASQVKTDVETISSSPGTGNLAGERGPTGEPVQSNRGGWRIAAVIAATVMLMLTLPVGLIFLSIALSRQGTIVPGELGLSSGLARVSEASRVVRVEEKLRREIEQRLREAGWRVEGISVNVTPNLKRAECRFGTAWKNGLSEIPFNAAIRVAPQDKNLWLVTGDGQFQFLRFSVDTTTEMAAGRGEPPPMTMLAVSFGPVRERTLNDMDDERGAEALDLASGKLIDLPKDLENWPEPVQLQWLQDQSADMLLDNVGGRWGLLTATSNQLTLAPMRPELWEAVPEAALSKALTAEPAGLEIKQRRFWRIYVLTTNAQPPLTFAFQTGQGARGLLQITRLTEEPNSMQLRYKRAQAGPADSVAGETNRVTGHTAAQAAPGEYKLVLPNGVSFEVVAVTRNPAEDTLWWSPDGTPWPDAPGARLTFLPSGMNTQMPNGEDDVAPWVRATPPPLSPTDARWQYRLRYSPGGGLLGKLEIHSNSAPSAALADLRRLGRRLAGGRGGPKTSSTEEGYADLVRFPPGTEEVTVRCATAIGPWEALAIFDGNRTAVLVEGTQVLCTHLQQEAKGKCLEVTHDVDRVRYALRMIAVFNDGVRISDFSGV